MTDRRRRGLGAIALALAAAGTVGGASTLGLALQSSIRPSGELRTRPPVAHTGGFGEPTCRACHIQYELNDSSGALLIEGLPEQYRRGERHRITITLRHPELVVAGFELAVRFDEGLEAGKQAGSLRALDTMTAVTRDSMSGVEYAHHSTAGVIPPARGRASWDVEWTAPNEYDPGVTVHVVANAGNDDFSELGDYIFAASKRVGAAHDTGAITMRPGALALNRGTVPATTDSIAAGIVSTDTSHAFTYERFGIALLRAAMQTSTPDSSRLISPLLAGQTLALALTAATDSTATAIEHVLHLGDLGAIDIAARSLRFNEGTRSRPDAAIRVANSVWVETTTTLDPTFRETARILYSSSMGALPERAPAIAPPIFGPADSLTNDVLRPLRRAGITGAPFVVLANALYFSGRWLNAFDSVATSAQPIVTARGARSLVPTMVRSSILALRRGAGYRAVRIPNLSGLTAMYLIVPDSGVSPALILDSLAVNGWPLPNPRTESETVQLVLPRFSIAQEADLQPAFAALGLSALLDPARAEFGALLTPRRGAPPPCPSLASGRRVDPCTRYRVHHVTHQVTLRVDERGIEGAAGISLAFTDAAGVSPRTPPTFTVNRPFLIAVRDERTGTFLFMGYIADTRS